MARYGQVLLLYIQPDRDYVVTQIMADCLKESNLAEQVIAAEMYKTIYNIYEYSPDLIIAPIRDEFGAQLMSFVKFTFGCRIVVIPTEQFMSMSDETMDLLIGYNKQPVDLVDKYLFWGPLVADRAGTQLIKHDKIASKEQISYFGFLLYEKNRVSKYYSDTEITRRISEKRGQFRRTIMFVTAPMGDTVGVESLIKEYAISEDDLEGKRKCQVEIDNMRYYSDMYFRSIECVAERCPDMLVLVKTHPVEKKYYSNPLSQAKYQRLIKYSNIIIIDEPKQISQYFESVSAFIHYGSTTSLEAHIYGIPTIYLLNDYEERMEGTFGTSYSHGDYEINVSDWDGLIVCVKGDLKVKANSPLDIQAKGIMNYSAQEEYTPSKLFVREIESLKEVRLLSYDDENVRHILNEKHAKQIRRDFIVDIAKNLIKCQIGKCKKEFGLLKEYYSRTRLSKET